MKINYKIIGVGLITAISSSLCCIAPILALVSGTFGFASTFSWLEPFRPYLIGLAIVILCFAWFQKLKPQKDLDCSCDTTKKPSFLQSKLALVLATIFAIAMTTFPFYSALFYSNSTKEIIAIETANTQTVYFNIKGMTCNSCEIHIDQTVNQLEGVTNSLSSFKDGQSKVEFNNSKTTVTDIKKVINSTGYTVTKTTVK